MSTLRQTVIEPFYTYTVGKEGFTPFGYADTLNMVSSVIGNLLDAGEFDPDTSKPMAERARNNNEVSAHAMAPWMALPWKHKGAGWTARNPVATDLATDAEKAAEWTRIKRLNEVEPNFSQRGGFAYAPSSQLTLSLDDVHNIFAKTVRDFAEVLTGYLPNFAEWPADAQFAAMSMAWGMGPNFPKTFKAWAKAATALDFDRAAEESFFRYVSGGTKDKRLGRNADNEQMFKNAARVVREFGDRDTLVFNVAGGAPTGPVASGPKPSPQVPTGGPGAAGLIAGFGLAGAGLYGLYQWWMK